MLVGSLLLAMSQLAPLHPCMRAMKWVMNPSSERVISDLKKLEKLTSDERGAQRAAWGPVWRKRSQRDLTADAMDL